MKIAVVYNRESQSVINLFGLPNREKIGMKTIQRLTNALKEGGHQVIALEGDKSLIDRLEEFMPRVMKGERPGMVFNVSYGIQGQARYTHVPSILEMVGIPYVASGPLAHSLALDKVVTKMILRQHDLPTPNFAVLETPDSSVPTELRYPLIVKPKNEAVSFGLRIVHEESELREGAGVIFDKFRQPVLAEEFIEGREVNVGLLGNAPPEAFPPVELSFGTAGPAIYTFEDKTGKSGRTIEPICPAPIGDDLTEKAQDLARRAFSALGCADCARVDMRLDKDGDLYILEINSLPSLGEHGSYLVGAAEIGLDFDRFVNRLVEVASARYFGTPHPPTLDPKEKTPSAQAFAFITDRRDRIEKRLREWTRLSSRTSDPVGLRETVRAADRLFGDLGLRKVDALTDERSVHTWETAKGYEGGTLFLGHLDVPLSRDAHPAAFRREPEWIHGEGVAVSKAPLVVLEHAFRALRQQRRLRRLPVGVCYYTDEGADCRYSGKVIREATSRARQVLVLRPGVETQSVVTQRRGQRKYRLIAEDKPRLPGAARKRPDLMRWFGLKLDELAQLGSQKEHVSVSALEVRTSAFPLLLPHRIDTTLLVTYLAESVADRVDAAMRVALGKSGPRWGLELISDRPPMRERRNSQKLFRSLQEFGGKWDIPLQGHSSVWPSAAGLVPDSVAVVCGVGPWGKDLHTPQEVTLRLFGSGRAAVGRAHEEATVVVRSTKIDAFNLPVGRLIAGKYAVEGLLGAGWEGEVYRVTEVRTGIRRAAKVFYPDRNPRDRALRFYATKLERLHKCSMVIRYHHSESFTYRGVPVVALVSELVEGEILESFVLRQPGRRLRPFEALHLLHALVLGVEEIHLHKEYHGDLHDRNVLVQRRGIGFEVKLLDFFHWGRPSRANMQDDIVQLARLLYDAVGGRDRYARQPPEIKTICCGLRRGLILRKFPTASHLRRHLESFVWDG
jgi:D-alanine-D-alanine ligase